MASSEKFELAVSGYIKQLKLSPDIPDVIKEIIIEFAKFYFSWKCGKYSKHFYKFNDEDPSILIRTQSRHGWAFLALQDVLSLVVCRKFQWEFKIIKKASNYSDIMFMFGFVEHPIEKSITIWHGAQAYYGGDFETRTKQFGAYIHEQLAVFDARGNHKGNSITRTDTVKVGDRFAILVDFEIKTMTLIHNDKETGVLYTDIPHKLHAAITVYGAVELKCTKYEFK